MYRTRVRRVHDVLADAVRRESREPAEPPEALACVRRVLSSVQWAVGCVAKMVHYVAKNIV